jgi:UDP-N-acetylmuramate dehydrogenase
MISTALMQALAPISGLICRRGESMAKHTTLRVGGAAELWMVAETQEALEAAALAFKEEGTKLHFFEDSHVLVRDGGLPGAWLRLGAVGMGVLSVENGIDVGAAYPAAALDAWMLAQGRARIPFLAGRAGSLADAYKAGLLQGWIRSCTVLRGTRLAQLAPENHADKQLLVRLTLHAKAEPLEEPEGQLRLLPRQIRAMGLPGRIVDDPLDEDAALLIREAGLCGVRLRGARIGRYESNAMVNLGESSAKDIWLLLQMIRDRVKLHSGIQLQPSLRRIGQGSN